MPAYGYEQWKVRIKSYFDHIEKDDRYNPGMMLGFLEENAARMNACKDDYISVIAGLMEYRSHGYAIEDYIIERFIKLSTDGFGEYADWDNPQFQEDLKLIKKISPRDIYEMTMQSERKTIKKVDQMFGQYFCEADRKAKVNPRERFVFLKIVILTILGTLAVMGGIVWVGMINATAGIIVLIVLLLLMIAAATIGIKKKTVDAKK